MTKKARMKVVKDDQKTPLKIDIQIKAGVTKAIIEGKGEDIVGALCQLFLKDSSVKKLFGAALNITDAILKEKSKAQNEKS